MIILRAGKRTGNTRHREKATKKTRKTFIILTIVFLLLAVVDGVTYNLIGSSVDEHGMQDPFFLIPLSFLSLFLSLVAGAVTLVVHLMVRHKERKLERRGVSDNA